MVTRIITAVVGIAIAIGVLFLSATPVFNLTVAAIAIVMLYELLSACKCIQHKFHSVVCFAFAAVMPFLLEIEDMEIKYIVSTLCIFLVFIGYIAEHKTITFEKICCMLAVTLLTTLSMCCIVSLKNLDETHGVCYVILCLAGAWLGDSGAYFVGTFLGKHKLCPEISPKKTVEGAIGGVITVGLVFAVYAFFYRMVMGYRGIPFEVNYLYLVLMGFGCGVLGIVGDLSASLIKRQFGIKDFGNIMPGHGGLMDRFDSVLFVAPFMMFMLSHFTLFR
ncbi:MAG: phosphatidate cytidylyltransferase [Oscillospiraceae bacterium]|nr:phosphatidate cytidylyltransferase [Oscillospiraceae bacterium]